MKQRDEESLSFRRVIQTYQQCEKSIHPEIHVMRMQYTTTLVWLMMTMKALTKLPFIQHI